MANNEEKSIPYSNPENFQERILNNIEKKKNDLIIQRVPKPTLERFKALAYEEYAGDYGMTLVFLVNNLLSDSDRAIIESHVSLEQRVTALEERLKLVEELLTKFSTGSEVPAGYAKMADGSLKKVGP